MLSVIWLWVSRREAHTYGRYKSNTSTDNFPRKAQSYSASEQAKANNGISNLKGANPLVYWKLFVDHNIIESSVMWLKFFWGVPPLLCLENYDTASCGHEIISLIVKLVPVTVPIGQSVRVFTGDTSQSVTTHELKSLTKSLHFWDNHLSSAFCVSVTDFMIYENIQIFEFCVWSLQHCWPSFSPREFAFCNANLEFCETTRWMAIIAANSPQDPLLLFVFLFFRFAGSCTWQLVWGIITIGGCLNWLGEPFLGQAQGALKSRNAPSLNLLVDVVRRGCNIECKL